MDSNLIAQAIFFLFAAMTVASAAVVVLARSLIHSAFALLFTFFGVAGLYVFLGADFLAATQMVIYVGGILILLLFGVMLTHKIYNVELRATTFQFVPGLALTLALFVLLVAVMLGTTWFAGTPRPLEPTTAEIGGLFLKDYILPFEVASVFLLIALIGAAMIVRRRPR